MLEKSHGDSKTLLMESKGAFGTLVSLSEEAAQNPQHRGSIFLLRRDVTMIAMPGVCVGQWVKESADLG